MTVDDLDATDEDARLARAEHWIAIRRPDQALAELNGLTGSAGFTPHAYRLRARVAMLQGRDAEAASYLRSSMRSHGPHPFDLWLLAIALHEQKDLVGAEDAILQALAYDPDHPDLLVQYAETCLASGDLDKATRLTERAAESDPTNGGVARIRVMLAYARGDDKEAARLQRAYVALDPSDPTANAMSTFLSASRGQMPQAYASARRWVADDPGRTAAVESARELKVINHWALWPLRPLIRYGPVRVYIVVVGLILIAAVSRIPFAAAAVTLMWLAFVVYSWTVPVLVRWLARRRMS